jgi:magnesium chelatase subunit I
VEAVTSNAERRAIVNREKRVVPRVTDVHSALPAITGKIELEYEGELQGAENIALDIVKRATGATFDHHVGNIDCTEVVTWFDEGGALKISRDERADVCLKGLGVVPGLFDVVEAAGLAPKKDPDTVVAASELVLEGLVAKKRISSMDEIGYARAVSDTPPSFGTGGGTNPFT